MMPSDEEKITNPNAAPLDSGTGSEHDGVAEELLVNTRTKRSTAGNRLHSLLQHEDADDELELLFAEDDEDAGFSEVDADQSDEMMDSSSDDEDHGPAAGDELDGERELQRAEKAEMAKKKKKRADMPIVVRKKVHVDTEPTRPSKKRSERSSWLPAASDAPLRASSRGTTRQSKQELQMQMMDREIKRLKQLANMEKAAAAKAAKAKPPLTQEDRLKEAARVEKANAKSLSRWERAEEERESEQRQRLANLQNRHMEGPVLTFWSGMATYVGGKLHKIGKMELEGKEKIATKKRRVVVEVEDNKKPNQEEVIISNKVIASSKESKEESTLVSGSASTSNLPAAPPDAISPTPRPLPVQPPRQPSSCLAPPTGFPLAAPHPFLAPPSFDGTLPVASLGYYQQPHLPYAQPFLQPHVARRPVLPLPPLPLPPPPPAIERCLRSSLIFSNFADAAIKSRETQLNILFPSARTGAAARFAKAPRSRGTHKGNACAITGYPAKYRDPKTGLNYCNAYAYQEIQKLQRGEIWWSDLLGLYVGRGTAVAARGVPDRFRSENKDSAG